MLQWIDRSPGAALLARIRLRPRDRQGVLVSVDLDEDGVALAAARADGGAAEAAAAPAQLVDERPDDAGARRADGMAQGDRSAVDVDLVLVDSEHAHRVDRDRRERLVDLPEVHV